MSLPQYAEAGSSSNRKQTLTDREIPSTLSTITEEIECKVITLLEQATKIQNTVCCLPPTNEADDMKEIKFPDLIVRLHKINSLLINLQDKLQYINERL